jgi:phospholipase/lecithinase/hemolysin
MKPTVKFACRLAAFVILATIIPAGRAQPTDIPPPAYTAIYAFGSSWTSTGDGPYWKGRWSNGPVWPEYLSTNLGLAYVSAKNFSVAGSTISDVLNSQIPRMRAPTNAELALFALGPPSANDPGNDIVANPRNATNNTFLASHLRSNVQSLSNSIVALYNQGARSIVVPNLYDFGTSQPVVVDLHLSQLALERIDAYVVNFNGALTSTLDSLDQEKRDLRIFRLGFNALLKDLLSNYQTNGFVKIDVGVWDDSKLKDKSYTGPGANYFYWDNAHVTTKVQVFFANWYFDLVTHARLENLELTSSGDQVNLRMNKLKIGRAYTVQKSSDLRNWVDIQSFTAGAGTNVWLGSKGNLPASFFRIRWEN